jgi:hypothetical protein
MKGPAPLAAVPLQVRHLMESGGVSVGIETNSHRFVIGVQAPDGGGLVPAYLHQEQALRLGIALVRLTGESYDFTMPMPETQEPPPGATMPHPPGAPPAPPAPPSSLRRADHQAAANQAEEPAGSDSE